jgi:hypothetical protein
MTVPTPFLGLGVAAAFLVLVPLVAVLLHRWYGGAWGRAAVASLLGTAAGLMAMLAAYTLALRQLAPGPWIRPSHGEWVVTRIDGPFAVAAWLVFAAAAWAATIAVYPARLRARVGPRSAVVGVIDVLALVALFALIALAR